MRTLSTHVRPGMPTRLPFPHSLATILFIALILRIIVYAALLQGSPSAAVFHAPDTRSYLIPARYLVEHGAFSNHAGPELRRTPGYPLLLAFGLWLGDAEHITVLLQIMLGVATVFMVYCATTQLLRSQRAARVAALLYAAEPLSLFYCSQLLSESLFAFLCALLLYLLLRCLETPRIANFATSALVLAAAAYVRPIALYLPLPLVGFYLCRAWYLRQGNGSSLMLPTLKGVCVFFLLCTTLLGAWQYRNYRVAGYPKFTAISDVNLYFYLAASVKAAKENRPFFKVQKEMGHGNESAYFAQYPEQTTWSAAERFTFMGREGARIVKAAPLTYVPIHLAGIARCLFEPGAMLYLDLFGISRPPKGLLGRVVDQGVVPVFFKLFADYPLFCLVNATFALILLLMYLFFIAGVLTSRLYRSAGFWLLLVIAGYLTVIAAGPGALSRFRHPVMPLVCVVAGAGFSALLRRPSASRKPVLESSAMQPAEQL